MSFWNADIPARTYVPVLAIVAVLAAIAFVQRMPASPPTAEQQQEQQQKQQNEARFDELREKNRLSLITLPNSAQSAGPPLTYDECMYLRTYNGGRFDGDRHLADLECRPEHYSDPEPRPVYIVPRP